MEFAAIICLFHLGSLISEENTQVLAMLRFPLGPAAGAAQPEALWVVPVTHLCGLPGQCCWSQGTSSLSPSLVLLTAWQKGTLVCVDSVNVLSGGAESLVGPISSNIKL